MKYAQVGSKIPTIFLTGWSSAESENNDVQDPSFSIFTDSEGSDDDMEEEIEDDKTGKDEDSDAEMGDDEQEETDEEEANQENNE